MKHRLRSVVVSGILLLCARADAADVIIRSLETHDVLHAQFNPQEVKISHQNSWTKQKNSQTDAVVLTFQDDEPATLQAELFFDTFESGIDVRATYVAALERFAEVNAQKKRPPLVQFEWGTVFPPFSGVIEKLDVRYTMFSPNGTPVRAVAAITLAEAVEARP